MKHKNIILGLSENLTTPFRTINMHNKYLKILYQGSYEWKYSGKFWDPIRYSVCIFGWDADGPSPFVIA